MDNMQNNIAKSLLIFRYVTLFVGYICVIFSYMYMGVHPFCGLARYLTLVGSVHFVDSSNFKPS